MNVNNMCNNKLIIIASFLLLLSFLTTTCFMFYLNRANANCRSIDGRTDVPQVAERKLRTNSQLLRPRGAL